MLILKAQLIAKGRVQRGRYRLAMHGNHRILPARFTAAFYASATADKAWSNIARKAMPRFSARRRMPTQAFWLK